jgi:hypothetical protein
VLIVWLLIRTFKTEFKLLIQRVKSANLGGQAVDFYEGVKADAQATNSLINELDEGPVQEVLKKLQEQTVKLAEHQITADSIRSDYVSRPGIALNSAERRMPTEYKRAECRRQIEGQILDAVKKLQLNDRTEAVKHRAQITFDYGFADYEMIDAYGFPCVAFVIGEILSDYAYH